MTSAVLTTLPARRPSPPPETAGALAVAAIVLAALGLGTLVPGVGPALWAMALGAAAAPLVRRLPGGEAAGRFAARPLLRAGVALLGLSVAAADLVGLGVTGLALAAGTLAATFLGTVWLGRALRVPRDLALLIGAGSAICGASAVAATASAIRADEDRVGYAVATVTLFGTLGMLLVPFAGPALLGLSAEETGMWAGASIHEVAQVAGAGAAVGAAGLATATLVKLARVALLAPAVALAAMGRGRIRDGGSRLPVPGFVLAFCALVAVRSLAPPAEAVLHAAQLLSSGLLAAGLAGLGLGIRLGALRAAGPRPLLLGLAAWLIAAAVSAAILLAA